MGNISRGTKISQWIEKAIHQENSKKHYPRYSNHLVHNRKVHIDDITKENAKYEAVNINKSQGNYKVVQAKQNFFFIGKSSFQKR